MTSAPSDIFTPERIPANLRAPIDMERVHNEKGVKAKIKALLDAHGWFHWMPAANGYGAQGVPDHLALKDGVFMSIEAKFGGNRPKPAQKMFAGHIMANSGFAFCVTDQNIDHLAWWLESFRVATQCQMDGLPVPEEHGARMLNSIDAMTELFA